MKGPCRDTAYIQQALGLVGHGYEVFDPMRMAAHFGLLPLPVLHAFGLQDHFRKKPQPQESGVKIRR